jgi:hypothetical protein
MFGSKKGVIPHPSDRAILTEYLTTCRFPPKKKKGGFRNVSEPAEHVKGRLKHHIFYAEKLDPYANEIDLLKEGYYIQNMYGGKKFYGLIIAYLPKSEEFQVNLIAFIELNS